jgi:hypothetical protein
MNELLKVAQENLAIIEVRLRSSEIHLSDRLRPEQVTELSLSSQGFSTVQGIATGVGHTEATEELSPEQSQEQMHLYTFRFSVGVRLVDTEMTSDDGGLHEEDEEDIATAVEIKAIFDAEYFSKEELEEDVLKEFAKTNVRYHVWPYWRELVQSTSARMGLKSGVLAVPFYFVPPKQQRQTDK